MNCTILNTQIPYNPDLQNVKINKLSKNTNKNYKLIEIKNKPGDKKMDKQYKNCKQGYVYEDARTLNNVLMTHIPLDRPCDESVKLKDIYKIKYPSSKNDCKDVSQFSMGDIQYYNDPNNMANIANQSLISKSKILYCENTNPMGVTEKSKTIVSDTIHKNNLSNYQYHRDDISRREELMLRALNKVKKNDYVTYDKK